MTDFVKIRNRFPRRCERCDVRVPVEAGFAVKRDGAWSTFCTPCAPVEQTAPAFASLRGDVLSIKTPYDANALPLLRSLPFAKFVREGACWTCVADTQSAPRIIHVLDKLGVAAPAELTAMAATTAQTATAVDIGLYPFQITGVDHLSRREKALLGDEMGLGKTVQILAALPRENMPPVVLVCPASLKLNWRNESKRWAPTYRFTVLDGRGSFRFPAPGEIVCVNYDILPATLDVAPAGLVLILDEAHYVKNSKTKPESRGSKVRVPACARAFRVKQLARVAARVWAATGTPLTNRPFDLWGVLVNTTMEREVFGNWNIFLRLFGGRKNKWGAYEFTGPTVEVPERMRRVMLRRLRKEVLPDLPAKTFTTMTVAASGDLMDAMDDLMGDEEMLDGITRRKELPPFEVFSAIRQQLAEGRIPAMLERVEAFEDAETPLLVFSAHRAPIDILDTREGWATITGDTSKEARQQAVEDFQAGKLKGLGITILAGGVGLTLTRASHALFIDLDWVPANNSQAEDRMVRIGQTASAVQIIRMVSDHVLDQHVHALLEEKIALAHAAIDATATPTQKPVTVRPAATEQPDPKPLPPAVQREDMVVTEELRERVHAAIRALAGMCDGAQMEDGAGFNRLDTRFGHELANRSTLTDGQVRAGFRMARRYRRQVGHILFPDGDPSAKPAKPSKASPAKAVAELEKLAAGHGAKVDVAELLDPAAAARKERQREAGRKAAETKRKNLAAAAAANGDN
jgi:hypothetical protein